MNRFIILCIAIFFGYCSISCASTITTKSNLDSTHKYILIVTQTQSTRQIVNPRDYPSMSSVMNEYAKNGTIQYYTKSECKKQVYISLLSNEPIKIYGEGAMKINNGPDFPPIYERDICITVSTFEKYAPPGITPNTDAYFIFTKLWKTLGLKGYYFIDFKNPNNNPIFINVPGSMQ